MSLKELPKLGKTFNAKANTGGHISLHNKLSILSSRSGMLNVLQKDDVGKISDKFDNPLIKKSIRYHGGLSQHQARTLKRKLAKDHAEDPTNFSTYKLKVAKKVVDHYVRDKQPVENPSLSASATPKVVEQKKAVKFTHELPSAGILKIPEHKVSVTSDKYISDSL